MVKRSLIPVGGGTHLLQLRYDAAAVLFAPLPSFLQEAFAAEVVLVDALFLQLRQ